MVAGIGLTNDNSALLELGEGVVGVVEQFKYLELVVEEYGGLVGEVSYRIAQASRTFGSQCESLFTASDLTMESKRMVYRSIVLGELMKPGRPLRSWLVSWTGFTDIVFAAFWV